MSTSDKVLDKIGPRDLRRVYIVGLDMLPRWEILKLGMTAARDRFYAV